VVESACFSAGLVDGAALTAPHFPRPVRAAICNSPTAHIVMKWLCVAGATRRNKV
jgi:hypothetical protein